MDPTSGSFIKATKPFFACLMLSGGGVRWVVNGVQWLMYSGRCLREGDFGREGETCDSVGGSLGKRMGGRHLFHFGSFFYFKKKKIEKG
jgi:hypothetical protein